MPSHVLPVYNGCKLFSQLEYYIAKNSSTSSAPVSQKRAFQVKLYFYDIKLLIFM